MKIIFNETIFSKKSFMLENILAFLFIYILVDMEDLKNFSKSKDAPEADDLIHWDTSFWSERLRESKFDINEVLSLSLCSYVCYVQLLIFICLELHV